MEPEVHIIEKYFQVALGCLTMTNIKCSGGKEIDLLAINPKNMERYHVESWVSTIFKLRESATYTKAGRCRRNGLDYFNKEKFEHSAVKSSINRIFGDADYQKVLVVWYVHDHKIPEIARRQYGIEVWTLGGIIYELMSGDYRSGSMSGNYRLGSRDDVLRLLELTSRFTQTIELKDSIYGIRKADEKKMLRISRSLGYKTNEDTS